MSQMKIEDVVKTPVVINGIQQNCYKLDCRNAIGVKPLPTQETKKYYALEEKQLPNGFVQELVEKDYPINSDSVSSYLETSDFRNDPLQAIANAPKRVNLGDISEVQQFINENPVEATRQYADLLNKVADYFRSVSNKNSSNEKPVEPSPNPANQGGEQ